MPYDRFLIGPFETGLQTNLKPLWVAEDAFSTLQNAYVFRGRVRKRFGARFMGSGWPSLQMEPLFSRFAVKIGTTDAGGNFAFTSLPGTVLNVGSMFSVSNGTAQVIFTVTTVPIIVGNATTLSTLAPVTGTVRLDSTGPNVYQFRITNGVVGIALTDVYWYPALPVMGLTTYSVIGSSINQEPSYGFDTEFVYIFANGRWSRAPGSPIFTGTNLNFFWDVNYLDPTTGANLLFVTNFNVGDSMYYFTGAAWVAFAPRYAPTAGAATGPFVKTALMMVQFKNSLLLLNTIENDGGGGAGTNTAYPQRCRFSAIDASPIATNAFYQANQSDNAGTANSLARGGSFVDAPTTELIISSEFIKDRLIVYFERSTWEIIYTGNRIAPFRWQKINTELGCEATYSTIPFDKVVLTMGNVGVHACSGTGVERVDDKIPDQVFDINNTNNNEDRTYGIRDYFVEQVYWAFSSDRAEQVFSYPDQVLVFNYKTGSWALNDDCITAFGYFNQSPVITWANSSITWAAAGFTWATGTEEAVARQVIAGNPEGFVFIVDADETRNARCLQITNMQQSATIIGGVVLTIIDHTIVTSSAPSPIVDEETAYIAIENAQYSIDGEIDTPVIYPVIALGGKVAGPVVLGKTIAVTIEAPDLYTKLATQTYVGGGYATRISNIEIESKQWNPYIDQGTDFYLAKIDFGVQKTPSGQITVDYFPSSSEVSMIKGGGPLGTNCLMGNSILETSPYNPALYPLESFQERLWHPIYFQTQGECIEIDMYFSSAQMVDTNIVWSDFQLEGMILHTEKTSSRLE